MQNGKQATTSVPSVEIRKIGVVTVTHNSSSVLAEFLECVWRQSHRNFLLYVVDSGSTDQTQQLAQEIHDPRVRCVLDQGNIGFAAGCNIGIRMAIEEGCDSVLLINNDTVFPPELFSGLLAGLDTHQCQMTTAKMLYFEPSNIVWAAGGYMDKWRAYTARHNGSGQIDDGRFNRSMRITFTPFCCILIDKSVFRRIGLLDESYFVYTEDLDYCYRAMRGGISLWYLPACRLWHKVSSLTGGDDSPFAIRYMTRNRILFLRKHFSRPVAAFWILVYQLHLVLRRARNVDSRACWQAKRRAVAEGLAMTLVNAD